MPLVQNVAGRPRVELLHLPLTAREQGMLKRDVLSCARGYELYLHGNQLGTEAKRWMLARDAYLRSVEEDPQDRCGGRQRPVFIERRVETDARRHRTSRKRAMSESVS